MSMVDTELLAETLRAKGHEVGPITPLPENAGGWEFVVDGETLTLDEVRGLLTEESR